jgi:DNA excision repair protein ERCC-1
MRWSRWLIICCACCLLLLCLQAPLNAVLVSQRQQGNPVLKQLRGVRWAFSDSLVPDYLCGANTAVLFLSLR